MDDKPDLQLYSTIFETWRFQVDSYWQRTSYFAAFETAALVGEWTILNATPAHIYTAKLATVLGIILTVLWFLNNLKTHAYVDYWWKVLESVEGPQNPTANASVDRDPFKIDFVSNYECRRKKLNLWTPIKYRYQVQAIPVVFLCAWTWLFFLPLMSSQPTHYLNQAEITTADRQSTTQPAINTAPAGTIIGATSVNQPGAQTNQSERTTDEKPKHDLIDHINLLSTAVIAVFTFMMFVVIHRQDRAMKIAERAWLVSDVGSLEPTKLADTFQVICKIHNKGRTPAWITGMASSGKYVKVGDDLPENIDYPQKAGPFTEKGSVLPPGACTETGIPITNHHLQLVRQEEGIFYLLGFIEYRDVFEVDHHTQYCYQLKASQDLTSREFEFYIGGPDRFNAAD